MRNPLTNLVRSFRSYNYRLWALGCLVSNVGTWMQRTAQDWLVLTQLTEHNASAVGIVMACQFGPQLLLLPVTGFVADYVDKRKFMRITQSLMGIFSLLLGVMTISGIITLWQVYLIAFLFGCASALDAPLRQNFVSNLVPSGDLANAVALNSTSFNAARMIGPAIAGLLIAAIGTGWAFVLNGLSYGAILWVLFKLRPDQFFERDIHPVRSKGSFTAGFIYVWKRPDLRAILLMAFVIGTFGLNFPIFISTMAASVFHTDAKGYGLLSSCLAIGTLIGSLISAMQTQPKMHTLLFGSVIFALGCSIAAFSPNYLFFAVILVVIGISTLIFNNTNNSLVQLSTDPLMRGRVIAIRMAILMGGTPIGAPIVGWIINQFGARWGLAIGALSGAVSAAIAIIYLTHERRMKTVSSTPSSSI
ncbi:MFS transporter [Celerinatantimonas sp. YJH-8]|uniref:MFS transporter n=1 Tax=Celerinatantimonas sp. YJH-8 TaxID=3228714 RepID=UPI0038BF84EA